MPAARRWRGGEAAWQAGRALRANLLSLAASMLQCEPHALGLVDGAVVDAAGHTRITLAGTHPHRLFPPGHAAPRRCSRSWWRPRHYVPREYPFAFTNGIQASWLEVDTETGFITLLKHWVVEDCGTMLNPMLVDEQVRAAWCRDLARRSTRNASTTIRARCRTPPWRITCCRWRAKLPDIEIAHVSTPTAESAIGAKGAGEAGTAAAAACVLTAVNDALAPFGAIVTELPLTPERILKALAGRHCGA